MKNLILICVLFASSIPQSFASSSDRTELKIIASHVICAYQLEQDENHSLSMKFKQEAAYMIDQFSTKNHKTFDSVYNAAKTDAINFDYKLTTNEKRRWCKSTAKFNNW